MSSIIYLILKSIKNSLLELIRKPAKLIMYIFIISSIIVTVIVSLTTQQDITEYTDIFWFKLVFFSYVMMFVIIVLVKSLSSGDTFFEMNDVNLLFVSPISPKKILIYGIVKLSKTAFLAGFFILFQSNTIGTIFGINFFGIFLVLIVFMLCMILSEILSLFIYSITNGHNLRKLIVKCISVLVFIPLAVYFLTSYISSYDIMTSIENTVNSPFLNFIPIAGWGSYALISILVGDIFNGLFFLSIIIISSIFLIIVILKLKSDYYEDVLCATEKDFLKKRIAQEGNINAVGVSERKFKVTKTGISGDGSYAIFSKHIRESFRENRFGFLNTASLIFIIGAALTALFMPDGSNCIMIMQILMWMQIFLIGNGRGLKELYAHYIYLIPEPSVSKIIFSNMEIALRTLVESIFMFGISGFILGDNILVILGVIICYVLFSMLLVAINYLSMRLTDANISNGILIFIYILAVVIIILPGVIPALIVGYSVGGVLGTLIGLLILSSWELIAGFVCFFLSKGILHNCDMPVIKPK